MVVSGVKVLGDGELPMNVEVTGYQHAVKYYADFYGVSDRTVKRWKTVGRKCGELPPLDDVVRFVDWWGVRMTHRVPDNIMRLLPAVAPKVEEKLDSVDLGGVAEITDMGLSTMRRVVAVKAKAVTDAYEVGDSGKISRAEKDLEGAVKTLRMLEKTHADLAKAGGDLVSKSWVRAELGPMMGRLSSSVLVAMIKAAQILAPDAGRDAVRAVCVGERDKCFSVVRGELVK